MENQKVKYGQASDALKQIEALKEAVSNRHRENSEVYGEVKRIIYHKCELSNNLAFRDFQLASLRQNVNISTNGASDNSEQSQKLEGLIKVNNFVRRKELEAREECEILKH